MSEKKQLIPKERYSLDAISVNQKVRHQKAKEEHDKVLRGYLSKISELEFYDVYNYTFDTQEDVIALKLMQERGHDRN